MFVSGARITSSVQLTDGDEIRIGAFDLPFRSMTGTGSTETQQ